MIEVLLIVAGIACVFLGGFNAGSAYARRTIEARLWGYVNDSPEFRDALVDVTGIDREKAKQ